MQDRQGQDRLAQQEAAEREVITALGQVARDAQVPPDFLTQVLARADQASAPRPGPFAWFRYRPLGHLPWGLEAVVVAVFVLAIVGAVPQYLTWFNAYIRGVPPEEEAFLGPLRTRGLGPPRAAGGSSLPLGPWHLNASGQRGQLMLTEVTPGGELRGTANGEPIVGIWDEAAQQMTFTLVRNARNPAQVQRFTGYLFQNTGVGQDAGTVTYTLTGAFTALADPGAVIARATYGWYAQKEVRE